MQKKSVKPFFSRFLTEQELDKVTGGGEEPPMQTMKFPSDQEDSGGGETDPPRPGGPITTKKYPSDNDEGGV